MRLRSVELQMAGTAAAAEFLEHAWRLVPAGTHGGTRYFRGTGDHPFILSISEAQAPAVTAVTFSGAPEEIDQVHARVRRAGAPLKASGAFDMPGGGSGFVAQGPEAQTYRFVTSRAVGSVSVTKR